MSRLLTYSEDRRPTFPEWLAQRPAHNDCQQTMTSLRASYQQDMVLWDMNHLLTYSEDSKPTFSEWLAQRHDTTSRELYDMFRATGSWNDYQRAMTYLRASYQQDMAFREALFASNPFTQENGTQQAEPDA